MSSEVSSNSSGFRTGLFPDLEVYPEGSPQTDALPHRPVHLALGMFDGVHCGHQEVIRQAIRAAGEEGHLSAVLTFDPHPSRVLYPDRATPLLMPLEQRIGKMLSLGVDLVFVQAFSEPYSRRLAEDFVPSLVEVFPSLKSLHIGENFRFGSGRSGDVATLRKTAESLGVEVHALQRKHLGDEPISSSGIRKALGNGNMSAVNAMLGYPYTVQGRVVAGKRLGRGIGFPTLNVAWNPEAAPRYGVYQIILRRQDETRVYRGIANYGVRPTVNRTESPLLEVHLIDGKAVPTVDDNVRIALLDFIRPEMTFSSVEALRDQIQRDVESVKTIFSPDGNNPPENF